MTNGQRLAATYTACAKHYEQEGGSLQKNESSWGLYVLEPALEVLGWPRQFVEPSPSAPDGTFFEYPVDKAADVALISGGRLIAFGELKEDESGCNADIRKHRAKYPELQGCRVAFAGWYGNGGNVAVYTIGNNSTLINVTESRQAPWKVLAHLAKPVLLGRQSREDWEQSPTESDQLPRARMSTRAIMEHFFNGVFDHWKELPHDRPYRLRAIMDDLDLCKDDGSPFMTFAHKDLHPVLPMGWGITLRIDSYLNSATCLFYERSTTALPGYCRKPVSFGPKGDLKKIDDLIADVIQRIKQRREEAIARKVL